MGSNLQRKLEQQNTKLNQVKQAKDNLTEEKSNMRKTNDEEIQRMYFQEGQTKRAISKSFGVSEQYIGKRLKQLEAFRLPDSFQKLTVKQKKYALARVEGKSKTDSAMEAYDTKDRTSAKALGHTLGNDPDITLAITDLMAQEGLTRRYRVKRLKDMVDCNDLNICGKGLEMANKLSGEYAPQNIDMITEVEIRTLIAMVTGQVTPDANVIESEDTTQKTAKPIKIFS